jgi:hypothetical protein
MVRRPRLWFIGASIFAVINLAGGVVAAAGGEWLHATAHFVLLLVSGYVVWRLAPSRAAQQPGQASAELDQRLDQLQQSVDAVALEIERIGEAQRFSAKLAAERVEKSAGGAALKPPPTEDR